MALLPNALPAKLPIHASLAPGEEPAVFVDTGGYDVLVGGHGFRLATSSDNPLTRGSEPTTIRRFDNSAEPGEQSLSQLPWVKSQSSFRGGAGQLNLEQGLTDFQYDQEEIGHVRFDTCQGVDVWTPGQVTRLPTTLVTGMGGRNIQCEATASVGGVDYAIVGGTHCLTQLAWSSGAGSAPAITDVDLTGSTFGGTSNCTVTSLCTDGQYYYGVVQMTALGYLANTLTYIIKGDITSAAQPTVIYDCTTSGSSPVRTNLCTNPDFETGTTGWAAAGSPTPTIAQSGVQAHTGSKSLLVTSTGAASFLPNAGFTVATTSGHTYTVSMWVYLNAGCPQVAAFMGGNFGTSTTVTGSWQRISVTFTATGSSHSAGAYCNFTASGQFFYIDSVLIEEATSVGTYFSGATTSTSTDTYAWTGTAHGSTSTDTPVLVPRQRPAEVGWAKARLVAGVDNAFYELNASASPHTALPPAKFTHPSTGWTWSCFSETPTAILGAGQVGNQGSILGFTLDTSAAVPTLAGGSTVAVFPLGELIYSMSSALNTVLGVGTTKGLHVAELSGGLTMGPLSVETTSPVYSVTNRDRFLYLGYSNQQPDGRTGLARVDWSFQVDQAGRRAWAPDLRPPTSAPTGLGTVTAVDVLPNSARMVWFSTDGVHVEQATPDVNDPAWIRTSRIRYDTSEMKRFHSARVTGSLADASITVTGTTPFGGGTNLGTFGFITDGNPGQFDLPSGLWEWLQLTFQLNGADCTFSSYQVNAYPAPKRQHIITCTLLCYSDESDRSGLDVTDPETPRQRYQNIRDLEDVGDEITFVEFTNTGFSLETVLIDQMQFTQDTRPTDDDDFGGLISLKLRIVK